MWTALLRSLSEALEQRVGTLPSAEWLGTEPLGCTDSHSRKSGAFVLFKVFGSHNPYLKNEGNHERKAQASMQCAFVFK